MLERIAAPTSRSCTSLQATIYFFGSKYLRLPHIYNASDAVTSLHVAKGLVDLFQWLPVRNEFINLELAVHVILHEIGQLRAALNTAKSTAFPNATSDELECYTTG